MGKEGENNPEFVSGTTLGRGQVAAMWRHGGDAIVPMCSAQRLPPRWGQSVPLQSCLWPSAHLCTVKLTGILVGAKVSGARCQRSTPSLLHLIPISGSCHGSQTIVCEANDAFRKKPLSFRKIMWGSISLLKLL